jgi:hypothetical protein
LLSKCLKIGNKSIQNHFTLTEKVVDDKINNFDPDLTSKMLDKFEEEIQILKDHILVNNTTDTQCLINDAPNNPLKKMVGAYIKSIEHLNKKS